MKMDREEATRWVTERWQRLGLDPAEFPLVFGADVENLVEGRLILPGREQGSREDRS